VLQLRREAPFRPVDWRWQMARLLREQSRRVSRRRDDEWVSLAKQFQTDLAACRDDWQLLDLAEKYPGVADARHMREDNGAECPRWEVEARLLAEDKPESIAARLALDPRAILAYEALFFNVQDRLHAQSWIVHTVMGRSIYANLTERQFDLLWKMYGYFGGPFVLDALVTTFSNPTKATSADRVNDFFSDDTRSVARRKSAIAMRTMPVNGYTQQIIVEIEQKYQEIAKIANAGESQGMLVEMVGEVMKGLAWSVGRGDADRPLNPMTVQVDGFAAEPRVGELMAITSGGARAAELETLTFPEATNVANR
jgi:hypothetical protein